jgi:hypothetical protein
VREACKVSLLFVLIGLRAASLPAQVDLKRATEPNMAPTSTQYNSDLFRTTTPPRDPSNPSRQEPSPHLVTPGGPPQDELNRREFEGNAGTNAGKLLLRSVPGEAQIFINGLFVGQTPLLISVAPGKYKIEMRGPRLELGHSVEIVMPKEVHTTLLNLSQRYPSTVAMH